MFKCNENKHTISLPFFPLCGEIWLRQFTLYVFFPSFCVKSVCCWWTPRSDAWVTFTLSIFLLQDIPTIWVPQAATINLKLFSSHMCMLKLTCHTSSSCMSSTVCISDITCRDQYIIWISVLHHILNEQLYLYHCSRLISMFTLEASDINVTWQGQCHDCTVWASRKYIYSIWDIQQYTASMKSFICFKKEVALSYRYLIWKSNIWAIKCSTG